MTSDDNLEVGTKQEMFELGRLNLSPTLSYEQWESIGKTLSVMAHSNAWWIGDFLLHGEHAYGEKWVQATALFDVPESTLQGYMYVVESFPENLRRRNLSWWAHREVAALFRKHPEIAGAHLDWVEAEDPTRAALRRRLKGEVGKVSGGTCRVCQESLVCEKCP